MADRPFERMPWLTVALLAGTLAWFALPSPAHWLSFMGICALCAAAALCVLDRDRFSFLRAAAVALPLVAAVGVLLIWARSDLVGTRAIGNPMVGEFTFRVLDREDREDRESGPRVRALVEAGSGPAITVNIAVPQGPEASQLVEGTVARARMRLIPPARAVVPGAYDPARAAWFQGIAGSGSLLSPATILMPRSEGGQTSLRRTVSADVRSRVEATGASSSAAAIAATLLTGDRTGIAEADGQAMRDAGLAHLLSISGLHVGAIVAIAWFCAMRGLALWPWLALRVRLPVAASIVSALAGISYTLMTGAEFPTIRACLASLLVLAALAIGRKALSLRLIAIAATVILIFWPEAAVSASFQLSFAAVIAIVAFHNAAPVARLRERARGFGWPARMATATGLLLLTGVVVELTLMPLVVFHFQRSGVYGAAVNLVAIPLTTFAVMPLLLIASLASAVGLGGPFWAMAGMAIDFVLALARSAAGLPGSVIVTEGVPAAALIVIAAGALWLALWSGRIRVLGLGPIAAGVLIVVASPGPDMLVSGDGRHVVIRDDRGAIYASRPSESFDRQIMLEKMGVSLDSKPTIRPLSDWPGAACNKDFCAIVVRSDSRVNTLLIALGRTTPVHDTLARACRESDLVISQRALPDDCQPHVARLGGRELSLRGGAAVRFDDLAIRHVRPEGDGHGW